MILIFIRTVFRFNISAGIKYINLTLFLLSVRNKFLSSKSSNSVSILDSKTIELSKSFSLKSDLDHITNLKKIKQELREEIDSLQRD